MCILDIRLRTWWTNGAATRWSGKRATRRRKKGTAASDRLRYGGRAPSFAEDIHRTRKQTNASNWLIRRKFDHFGWGSSREKPK